MRFELRVLQFLPDTQELARNASDGEWHHEPHLELAGTADMKNKPESYSAYQDRMFQELQDLSDEETQGKKKTWAALFYYGSLCGLSEQEVKRVVGGWTPQMGVEELFKMLNSEGRERRKSRR